MNQAQKNRIQHVIWHGGKFFHVYVKNKMRTAINFDGNVVISCRNCDSCMRICLLTKYSRKNTPQTITYIKLFTKQ